MAIESGARQYVRITGTGQPEIIQQPSSPSSSSPPKPSLLTPFQQMVASKQSVQTQSEGAVIPSLMKPRIESPNITQNIFDFPLLPSKPQIEQGLADRYKPKSEVISQRDVITGIKSRGLQANRANLDILMGNLRNIGAANKNYGERLTELGGYAPGSTFTLDEGTTVYTREQLIEDISTRRQNLLFDSTRQVKGYMDTTIQNRIGIGEQITEIRGFPVGSKFVLTRATGDISVIAPESPIDYTKWAKEVYGSPGYTQPGVAHVPYEKELGYANAIIQSTFDPGFWQEQLFESHKGVDIVNKHLYESQHLENIGYNETTRTFDPMKGLTYTISRPLVSNVIIPVVTMTGLGAGLGILTKAIPAAGAIGKATLTGVGAYYVGVQTIPPAVTGLKTGSWAGFQRNILGLGIQLPFMMVSFTEGYNAVSKFNIPTLTTRGTKTLDIINTNVVIPMKTAMNTLNPRNLWVKWGATERFDIVSPRVTAGRSRFPTSRSVEETLWSFEKGYNTETGLYETIHARARPFKGTNISDVTIPVPERGSDVYGLYVSPYGEGSSYFTRIGTKVPEYGYVPMEINILPSKPSFRLMLTESISRAPKGVRYDIKSFEKWQLTTEPRSTATISPAHEMGLKMEMEAVISPVATFSTTFKPIGILQRIKGYGEYTTVLGRSVPVYGKYRVWGEGMGVPKVTKEFYDLASSDYGYTSGVKSIFSPSLLSISYSLSSILNSTGISSKKSSYSPSYSILSSYKPVSSIISSKIPYYEPPYHPTTSYVPPYKPPYYPPIPPYYPPSKTPPSYVPPYEPPYYPPYEPPYYPGIPNYNPFPKKKGKKKRQTGKRGSRYRVHPIQLYDVLYLNKEIAI